MPLRLLTILTLSLVTTTPSRAETPRESAPVGLASKTIRLSDGTSRELRAPGGGALVLIFTSVECPISNEYTPALNAIARSFPADKLRMIAIGLDPDLAEDDLSKHAKEFALAFPIAADRRGHLATKLGVRVTPEVVVIDDKDCVRYQGRIDDRYADRGKRKAHLEREELREALTALLAGREVANPKTEAVGCPIPTPAKEEAAPTYSGRIASILKDHCVECHRPGQVGPFSLLTYEQARKRAADLANVVDDKQMPPWKPEHGFGPKLKNDRSLSKSDIDAIVAWAEAGAPEGEHSEAPLAASSADGWALGSPDLIVQPAEDFAIPAAGSDIYRCFVIPTDLPRDMYVSAVEYRPGNRAVVHHMICYVDTSGKGRERDQADPGQGYSCFSGPGVDVHGDLGGWAPGNEASFLPEGIGRSLPKGGDVIMQVHYHPDGKPETDRSRIGLHFSRKPVRQVIHWTAAANQAMAIPPGESKHAVPAHWVAPVDMDAYAVTPHMHLLGRDMTMVLTEPDGKTTPLIRINDWDFQWQNTYYFETPIRIKKGTTLDVIAHFDNSAANPRNPNKPPREVRWGEATTDEMCIGFLAVTKAGQDLTQPGEADDLGQIIDKSFKEEMEKYRQKVEAEKKERAGR